MVSLVKQEEKHIFKLILTEIIFKMVSVICGCSCCPKQRCSALRKLEGARIVGVSAR